MKRKQIEIIAHPTEDGWCCACEYDIAVMERKIREAVNNKHMRSQSCVHGHSKHDCPYPQEIGKFCPHCYHTEIENLVAPSK